MPNVGSGGGATTGGWTGEPAPTPTVLPPPTAPPPDYAGYAQAVMGPGSSTAPFSAIIAQAIAESWTAAQLQQAILSSPQFSAMFPGILRPDGSLRMSATEWRQLAESYYQIGRDYGVAVGPLQVGMLIERETSPDEFLTKSIIVQKYRETPGLLDDYNEVRRADGLQPLTLRTFFEELASGKIPSFYDHYEAANLLNTQGLDIDAAGALRTARELGAPGELTNLTALAQAVRDQKADIGAELLQAGITDEDVLKLEGGFDPRGIAPRVATIIANRRAQGRYVPGSTARQGSAGGVAILPEERPESY